MKFLTASLTVLLLLPSAVRAQTRQDMPYLLPQTIFVGDSGRLVVPLGSSSSGLDPFVVDAPEKLPEAQGLVIRRIELERRGGNLRLLIDFIPYAPGTLSLPALDFFSVGDSEAAPGAFIPSLEVQVASILDPANMALSEPASPLAAPGTSLLIYGTVALILVILSLGIGSSLWVRGNFKEFWGKLRRRRLLRSMIKFIRRLRHECAQGRGKNLSPGEYLTLLSSESREFLSLFTGINCRSLTAGEFINLPLTQLEHGCLSRLFRAWDALRFSGLSVDMANLSGALDEIENIVILLDRAEREKSIPEPTQDNQAVLGEAS